MLLRSTGKQWVLLSLLVVGTAAQARPTVDEVGRGVVTCALQDGSHAQVKYLSWSETNQTTATRDSHLAAVAADFLKPPTGFVGSAQLSAETRSLPPVPAALYMALVGFACVSFIEDRKAWMAALAGLLWAGQIGFAALPQFAYHLVTRKQAANQQLRQVTYPRELEEADRLRSDIDGTKYIGLLRHLAGIPSGPTSFLPRMSVRDKLQQKRNTRYAIRDTSEVPQFALTEVSAHFLHAFNCLAPKAKQIVYFSPAFIFSLLARGPPELTPIDSQPCLA